MAKIKIDENHKDLIRELADLLDETGLSEIELEHGSLRVRVARAVKSATPAAGVAAPPEKTSHGASDDGVPGAVTSPMVGTVFHAPEPGAAPFIEVGARVSQGQTCMIVEAMKTMNPIAAPRAGTITAILVEDAQPVEFGEPLFAIE